MSAKTWACQSDYTTLRDIIEDGEMEDNILEQLKKDPDVPPARHYAPDCFRTSDLVRNDLKSLMSERALMDCEVTYVNEVIALLNKVEYAHALLMLHEPGCNALKRVSDARYSDSLMFCVTAVGEAVWTTLQMPIRRRKDAVERMTEFIRRDGEISQDHLTIEYVIRLMRTSKCCSNGASD
jgi:hypothetical protein